MTFAIAYVRVRRDDVMITILRIILCCYYRIWGLIIAIFQSRLKLQLLGAGDYILSISLPLLLLCLFSPLSLLFFPLLSSFSPLSLRVLELCRNVKDRVFRECEKQGVNVTKYPPLISSRYVLLLPNNCSFVVGVCSANTLGVAE